MFSIKTAGIILSITGIAISSSCTKPDIAFGADYLDNNYTNVVVVDTATTAVSTILLDSFPTSATGKAVIGNYTDPEFGSVSAEAYFPLTPPVYTDVYAGTTFDSLELVIKPNKSFYGDTSKPIQLIVQQLEEPIAFGENQSQLYNVSSFPAGQILGSKSLVIRPSVTDSISIRLSAATGADLLSKLQAKSDTLQQAEKFTQFFRGIRLSSGSTSSYMLGLSDSIIMRLHYKKPGVIQENQHADFTLSNNTLQFNHINTNRTGTTLSALSAASPELPSADTKNAGFLQTATGTVVKLSFPYLKDFLQVKNYLKIIKAELIVRPIRNSFTGPYTLPSQLRLSETTQLNQFGTDISVTDATGAAQTLYGDLVIDDLYGENTSYTYDITTYINTQIGISGYNRNGLLISPPSPSFQSDFNRVLIGDRFNTAGAVKLRIYYLTVNL